MTTPAKTEALLRLRALLRGELPPQGAARVSVLEPLTTKSIIQQATDFLITSGPPKPWLDPKWIASSEAAKLPPLTAEEQAANPTYVADPTRKYQLRAYQLEAVIRMRELKRALLWDNPGLGKTLQASEAAVDRPPILVSAPNYLTNQWFEFLCEQYPNMKICIVEGTRAEREKVIAQKFDWYIINHEMFRSYKLPKVNSIIIDEAHHFRGHNTKQGKALVEYARDVPQVFELTATPLYKSVDSVYMLLRILAPEKYKSRWGFIDKHCRTYETSYGVKILGVRNGPALYAEMGLHGLGRTYKDVELELPELINRNIAVVPDKEFITKYNEVRLRFRYNEKDVNSLMEAMHIMRRMTLQPKLAHMEELLQDDAEGAIFTWYTDSAKILAELFGVPCITGEMPAMERGKTARDHKLIVGSMASMSEGVDLSHLNNVIFFEGDYVPARLYQALSRVRRHRMSAEPVRATYLYTKGTIDEIVHHAATTRNATIKSVMKQALIGDD